MAATLAFQADQMLKPNLEVELTDNVLWTDSAFVLQVKNNTFNKFLGFVASRLFKIERSSNPKQ